jgi:hypothetical protein
MRSSGAGREAYCCPFIEGFTGLVTTPRVSKPVTSRGQGMRRRCTPGRPSRGTPVATDQGLSSQPEALTPKDRHVKGVRVRRVRRSELPRAVITRGIPVTSVPRTLVDLASSLPEPALARACHEAGVLYRTTPKQVSAVLNRLPNALGRKKLERVLHGDVRVTLSKLESRFLELLRDARIPLPITNKVAGRHRVDCRWPEQRLSVELDSYRYHGSRHAWDKDLLREREARSRGDEFRRYAWRDVFEDPAWMLEELRDLLGCPELGAK